MHKIQKRFLTLIEIMIVMFLIMLIMGVVAYNYRGALDEGKAFKSTAGINQIEQILDFAIAQDPNVADGIESNWESIVEASPLVKKGSNITVDGWGEPYRVTYEGGRVVVSSQKLTEYRKNSKKN